MERQFSHMKRALQLLTHSAVFLQKISLSVSVQGISTPLLHFDMSVESCQRIRKGSTFGGNTSVVEGFQNLGSLGQTILLIPNLHTTSCALGMGVTAEMTEEVMSSSKFLYLSQPMQPVMTALRQQQENDGFSMTLWIKHATQESVVINTSSVSYIQPIIRLMIQP
jgi:hypothetical protein